MSYVWAVLALGFLVAVHELGHLGAARLFRIRVLRYSIGFGPAIFTLRRGETDYVLAALPFGGYCQIDPAAFQLHPPWKRTVVLAAGSAVNYVAAVILLTGLYAAGTRVPVPMTVGQVQPGSAAARALLRPGDRIVAVDGSAEREWPEFVERVNESAGKPLILKVERDGTVLEVAVTPVADESGVGHMGVSEQGVFRRFGPGDAFMQALREVGDQTASGFKLLAGVFRKGHRPQLSTPIGIVRDAAEATRSGVDPFIALLASVSVALALFNLLPFPALDGGRIALTLVEAVRGRPVSPTFESLFHTVGFVVLISVFIWVGAQDVGRIFSGAPPKSPPAPSPARPVP